MLPAGMVDLSLNMVALPVPHSWGMKWKVLYLLSLPILKLGKLRPKRVMIKVITTANTENTLY